LVSPRRKRNRNKYFDNRKAD